jgi:hypothetical protein
MANNPPFQYNYNAQGTREEGKEEAPAASGWFSNPLVGKLWGASASVLKTGGSLVSSMGSAMQQKLEEHGMGGVTQTVTTFVSSAAEKTVEVGAIGYSYGKEKLGELQQNP